MIHTLLWNANYIDAEGQLQNHKNLEITDGVITAISVYVDGMILPEANETIECKDFVVTPGFTTLAISASVALTSKLALRNNSISSSVFR